MSVTFDKSDDPENELQKKGLSSSKDELVAPSRFEEYCQNSSVHGVQYIGDSNRHWSERIWWVIVFVISIYGCVVLIMNVWDKWEENPVMVSFAQTPTSIWDIPFPAVTICSETKIKKSVFNYEEALKKIHNKKTKFPSDLTLDERKMLEIMLQICIPMNDRDIWLLEDEAKGTEIIGKIQNITLKVDDIFQSCFFAATVKSVKCANLFDKLMTEEGICYIFNNHPRNRTENADKIRKTNRTSYSMAHLDNPNWSLEEGYARNATIHVIPYRGMGDGTTNGLKVNLRLAKADLDKSCRENIQGFKVLVHQPGEQPRVTNSFIRVPLNSEVSVALKPQMVTTSEGLRDYTPARRNCLFKSERSLRYYPVYTMKNCQMECRANFTISYCGCVPFYMPKPYPESRICGIHDIGCYGSEVEMEMLIRANNNTVFLDKPSFDNRTYDAKCNCIPACTSIEYDLEMTQASIGHDANEDYHYSTLKIFFKEPQFIAVHRSELFGRTDFLASCGGLLGLFMGVSFLSIIEILYFTSIRIITQRIAKQKLKRPNKKHIQMETRDRDDGEPMEENTML